MIPMHVRQRPAQEKGETLETLNGLVLHVFSVTLTVFQTGSY